MDFYSRNRAGAIGVESILKSGYPGERFANVVDNVLEERRNQFVKWGDQEHSQDYWLGILVEEVGEFAKAVIERDEAQMKTEGTQVAAVMMAILEALE